MARRATILKKYKHKALIIGGFYEFTPYYRDGVKKDALKMVKAYESLPYNFIVVRKVVKDSIEKKGLQLSSKFISVNKKPIIKKEKFKEKEIYIFLFPDLSPEEVKDKFDDYLLLISKAPSKSITVALVPWGVDLEDKFLNSYAPDLDILLGSGDGFSYFTKIGKTLWIHPCKKGECIYRVFERKGSFYVERITLDESISEDPTIKELIR